VRSVTRVAHAGGGCGARATRRVKHGNAGQSKVCRSRHDPRTKARPSTSPVRRRHEKGPQHKVLSPDLHAPIVRVPAADGR